MYALCWPLCDQCVVCSGTGVSRVALTGPGAQAVLAESQCWNSDVRYRAECVANKPELSQMFRVMASRDRRFVRIQRVRRTQQKMGGAECKGSADKRAREIRRKIGAKGSSVRLLSEALGVSATYRSARAAERAERLAMPSEKGRLSNEAWLQRSTEDCVILERDG